MEKVTPKGGMKKRSEKVGHPQRRTGRGTARVASQKL
jgi:hypothetical protein